MRHLAWLCLAASAGGRPQAPRAARARSRTRGGLAVRGGLATGAPAKAKPAPPPLGDAIVAGALASVAGDLALHPVDTVKTIQQATGVGVGAAVADVAARGPLAFYDGVVPYVVGDGLSGAVKFAVYEKTKAWAADALPEGWVPAARFACAAVAFLCCSVILVPGELLKSRIQAGAYPNLVAGLGRLLRDEGLRGCYTGYRATLFRDVPYTMLELGCYDALKGCVAAVRRRGAAGAGAEDELVAAALTGGLVGFLTNPLDVVKTRVMTAGGAATAGPLAVLGDIWSAEGAGALVAGATARVLWLAPFTVIYFGCYELLKRKLAERRGV